MVHIFLDNDDAGRKTYKKADNDGVIKVFDTTFVNCRGMSSSELEDCFDKGAYHSEVFSEFGVNFNDPSFRGNQKWSGRAKNCFENQGKQWGVKIEAQLKAVVAGVIAKKPYLAPSEHKRNSIDALVKAIESKLGFHEEYLQRGC